VLHRDLAARNILVYDFDSIKIADFGLARNICSDYYYVQKLCDKMPYKWMSPESLTVNKISEESDVWSYGVLLWEIYTYGCTPYPTIPIEQILEKLTCGYRMDKPESCDLNIYHNIMLACWNLEPKKRPKFLEISEKFEKFFEQSKYEQTKNLLENRKKRHSCASYEVNMDFEYNNEECQSDTTKTTNTSSMTSETSASALSGTHQLNTTFNSSSGSSQNQNTSQISSLASSITSEKNDKEVFGKLQKIDESNNFTTELENFSEHISNKFAHKFGNNKLNFFKKFQSSSDTIKDEKETKFQQLQKPNNIETSWPEIYK
jgi:serine/threonine protein kinase